MLEHIAQTCVLSLTLRAVVLGAEKCVLGHYSCLCDVEFSLSSLSDYLQLGNKRGAKRNMQKRIKCLTMESGVAASKVMR